MWPTSLFRLSDLALVSAVPGYRLYQDGFGDREALEQMVEAIRSYDIERPLEPIQISWQGRPQARGASTIRKGWFTSPLAHRLPVESRRAPVELIEPREVVDPLRPACVMLAATGEEGFWLRRRHADRLAHAGIASLLLENPFYGLRRPRAQSGPFLRTVEAQFAMNLATVDEARALLGWLRAEGHSLVGVTGYSQGGVMAAFAAALSPFPVAVVPRGAGNSAAPIFTNAALSRRIAWSQLAAELGGLEAARDYFRRCLEPVRVNRFRPPQVPRAAIILHARGDGFVPPDEAEALHRHWAGSELRWLVGGHLTTSVLHAGRQMDALRDALAVARGHL